MNILIVSSYLPYPLLNGGNIRLYNLMKQLAKNHTITLICERRPHETDRDVLEVEKICEKMITVPRKKQWSLSNIIRTGLSPHPFLLTGHTLPEMTQAIERELSQKPYDVIHVETFYVLQNVPDVILPVVLVEHNIEYLVYKRYADKAPLPLRPFLSLDILKLKRAEERAWQSATVVAAVSEEERQIIKQEHTVVVPNGVDTKQFSVKKIPEDFLEKDKKILYIGDYKWLQNKDAATFIIREIWPEIKAELHKQNVKSQVKLWIVGRHMPESLKELGKGDTTILFDDSTTQTTPEIFSEADVLLAPKRVGGGTSYKILEAMAVGTPVVTTSLGLEGLLFERGEDIIVADTPSELARETVRVLTDRDLYAALSQNGRLQIERYYDWTAIAQKLEDIYHTAVGK